MTSTLQLTSSVPELPHKTLLDRDGPPKVVAERYAPQLNLLTDMVNFTSNLIPRAFQSSEKQLRDLIICYTLLKQFAMVLDAVDVLARAGAITAAHVPARAASEASLRRTTMSATCARKGCGGSAS